MRLTLLSFCISIMSFLSLVYDLQSQEVQTGSIHGRVTIGVDETPVKIGMLTRIEVFVVSLDVPNGLEDIFVDEVDVDSLGYYQLDSVPVGSVSVMILCGLPPVRPQKAHIQVNSDTEVNFVIAPEIDGAEFEVGVDFGAREAQQMWNMGLASVKYRSGCLVPAKYYIDTSTGLRTTSIIDNHWLFEDGFVESYKSSVEQLIEERGSPSYSLKPWLDILLDLRSYFQSQADIGLIDTLWKYGPAVFSPDSSYYLLGIYWTYPQPHRSETYRKDLVEELRFEMEFKEIVWGPNGSNFFVTRHSEDSFSAQDRDSWEPLCEGSYVVDTASQNDSESDTALRVGSIEGYVTMGQDEVPIYEARVAVKDCSAEFYASGEKIWWLDERTDSSGYYRIDSIPVGEATIECGAFSPYQRLTLEIEPDTAKRQDFTFVSEFLGDPFEYGLAIGRKAGMEDWMLGEALILSDENQYGKTRLDSINGLQILGYFDTDRTFRGGHDQGYVKVIDSLIMADGLPSYSKKPWLSTIANSKTYFDSQQELGLTDTIWQFGKPLLSADSSIYLRFGIHRELNIHKREDVTLYPVVPFAPVLHYRVIAWGPENSRFFVEKHDSWEYENMGNIIYTAYSYNDYAIPLNTEYYYSR